MVWTWVCRCGVCACLTECVRAVAYVIFMPKKTRSTQASLIHEIKGASVTGVVHVASL